MHRNFGTRTADSRTTLAVGLSLLMLFVFGLPQAAAGVADLPDCNSNGIPDECDIDNDTCHFNTNCLNFEPHCGIPDCDGNFIIDICDIESGSARDCNTNGTPDQCEDDCNDSGAPDDCDITEGTSDDCNGNDTPDECDVSIGTFRDCDGNLVPDICEDCDGDNIPDQCELDPFSSKACFSNCCQPDERRGDRPPECSSQDQDGNDIPDECAMPFVCPPLDLVVVMDTSGSMETEAEVLCADIGQIIQDLLDAGISVNATLLGISDTPGGVFGCLQDNVVNLFGPDVPGGLACCSTITTVEDWGGSTAVVSDEFPWLENNTRAMLVFSDEGPEGGDPCEDPGDDRAAISNAIDFANANDVFVSTLVGDGAVPCTHTLAQDLAAATGGSSASVDDPASQLSDAIAAIVATVCTSAPDFDRENADIPDACPGDPAKISPGPCGCGVSEEDLNGDNTPDCLDGEGQPGPDQPTCALCGTIGVAFYMVTLSLYAAMLFARRRTR